MKKSLKRFVAVAIVLCLAVGAFSACAKTKQASAEVLTYVSLSINPKVEFTVDGDNKVLSANPVNADCEVLLSGTNLVGMDIEQASEQVVALCVEAGYLDVDAKKAEVELTVVGDDSGEKIKIENSLETRLNRYFDNNGIFGKVSKATLDEFGGQAVELGVSTGHMKMILRAIDLNPTMTLEQLAAMPLNELVALIKTTHNIGDLCFEIKDQLKIDKEALKVKCAELFAIEDEVDALEKKIAEFKGSVEEKAVLESELATLNARMAELKTQYENELKALIEKANVDSSAIREQQKTEKKEKIEKNKDKVQSHKNGFMKNEKKIKDEIEKWRNGIK